MCPFCNCTCSGPAGSKDDANTGRWKNADAKSLHKSLLLRPEKEVRQIDPDTLEVWSIMLTFCWWGMSSGAYQPGEAREGPPS